MKDSRTQVDLLVVAPNTTPGLRSHYRTVVEALLEADLTVHTVTTDYGLLNRFRRGRPFDEIVVTVALRHATARALKKVDPKAFLLATSQTGLLLPKAVLRRSAIRIDGLAASTRQKRRDYVTRLLERRCLREASLLLPYTQRVAREAAELAPGRPTRVWPSPVSPGPGWASSRTRGAVCYANDPYKKGLDIAVGAWTLVGAQDSTLFVTGISETDARRYLRRRRVEVPSSVVFCGRMSSDAYRLLSSTVEIHLGSSRLDEFASTQLEALMDGAILVTVPSAGPIAPLDLALTLDSRLVAKSISSSDLGVALEQAMRLPEAERATYRARAAALMQPFDRDHFLADLKMSIIPALLRG